MKIRDIVNRDIASLKTCESEPIHLPGSIQPQGYVLAMHPETGIVEFCSANCEALFKLSPEKVLRQPLSTLLENNWRFLESYLQSTPSSFRPLSLSIRGESYQVVCHKQKHLFILEIEPSLADLPSEDQLFEQTRQFVLLIDRSRSLQQLCQNIADETRKITGYDRVMNYRFDKEYNGEVYAESKSEELEPYLGLHYPHTDIPVQARALYVRNLLRLIPDVGYRPVPLLTLDEGIEKTLDLSDVGLRSVSPIHLQYLKNMGVGATLTISLLQDGKLWGLIACHHQQPRNLSFALRRQALLQGHFLSSQIRVRQVAEEYEVSIQVEAHLQQLLGKIGAEEDFDLKFEQFTSLLALSGATGAVIVHKGEFYEKGLVPAREETVKLLDWIEANVKAVQFITTALHTRYPDAVDISDVAAGILYHSLGRPKENSVIWFRQEVEKTIRWAGDPNKAVQKDPVTNMLMPRTSFELWKERVRYQSREWRVSEINAAGRFATALQNHFHLLHLQGEEFRLRLLNDKLQKANQELSNINWITSHDLKEPLRKIQVFASRIAGTEEESVSQVIRQSVERIQRSTSRMTELVNDILSYSLTDEKRSDFVKADLNEILEEALGGFSEEISEKGATVHKSLLPQSLTVIPYQMRQLFGNLIGNALKFAAPDRQLQLWIRCRKVKGADVSDVVLLPQQSYYEISLEDNGQGFDPDMSQRLFDIFYRAHSNPLYGGTGIGLALSKKIIENHKGAITARGRKNEGASFVLYLPA